jgi:hypothetical protein
MTAARYQTSLFSADILWCQSDQRFAADVGYSTPTVNTSGILVRRCHHGGSEEKRQMMRRACGSQSTGAMPLMELLTIMCGIAATVAISQLASVTEQNGIPASKVAPLNNLLLFATTIITIARFYHSNMRHLDDEYAGRHGRGRTDRIAVDPSVGLATDFAVAASEALILVYLAYLLQSPVKYILANSMLLLIDSTWFFFFHYSTQKGRKNGVANNLLFGVIFLVGGLWLFMAQASARMQFAAVAIFVLLVLMNTIIGVTNEFDFYFPTVTPRPVLFLAAPFTGVLKQDSGIQIFDDHLKEELNQTINYFEGKYLGGKRYEVLSAHRRQAFGDEKMTPAEALAKDLEWLESASVVIAVLSGDTSPGLQIELGAALALRKPIIQVIAYELNPPYLDVAFFEELFADERRVYVIHGNLISNLHKLEEIVDEIMLEQSPRSAFRS